MSRFHLLILWVLVIGTGFLFFNRAEKNEPKLSQVTLETGSSLFERDFLENIDSLEITNANGTVTIAKNDGVWQVAEEDNYPADLDGLSSFLNALRNAKVASSVVASDEYYDRFHLDPETEDTTKKPFVVTLKKDDQSRQLFVGKSRESTGGSASTAGRFVRLADDESGVYIVQESFASLSQKARKWLDQAVSPLEEVALEISVTAPNEENFTDWTIARKSVNDPFVLSGLEPNKETNSANTAKFFGILSGTRFVNLLSAEEAKQSGDEADQRVATIKDSAGSRFQITITPVKMAPDAESDDSETSRDGIVSIEILDGPTMPEPVGDDADTKAKAVYAEQVANLSDLSAAIAKMRKTYTGRYYLMKSFDVEPFFQDRSDLIKEKEEPKAPVSVTTPPIRVPALPAEAPQDSSE